MKVNLNKLSEKELIEYAEKLKREQKERQAKLKNLVLENKDEVLKILGINIDIYNLGVREHNRRIAAQSQENRNENG